MPDPEEPLSWPTNQPVMERDNWACSRCGRRAHTVNHRIRGRRKDRRPSNLHAVCGDGSVGCHSHITVNPADALRWGWQCYYGSNPAEERIWMEAGVLGRGFYLLGDDGSLRLTEVGGQGPGGLTAIDPGQLGQSS